MIVVGTLQSFQLMMIYREHVPTFHKVGTWQMVLKDKKAYLKHKYA